MQIVIIIITGVVFILSVIWNSIDPSFNTLITCFSAFVGFLGSCFYKRKNSKMGITVADSENMIVFLEDKPADISDIVQYCSKRNYRTEIISTPHSLVSILHENIEAVSIIVMDIMMHGILNLESLKIIDSDTDNGFNAGWVIIDRILRPNNSETKPFMHIPILIVTNRILRNSDKDFLEKIRKRGGGKIDWIEKDFSDANYDWEKLYKTAINNLI